MEEISVKEIVAATKGRLLQGLDSMVINHVSTDSRDVKEKTLFIPIIGERVDAHDYVQDVINSHAFAVLISRESMDIQTDGKQAVIYVEDTKDALQDLAAYYRSKFVIPVIGITGSVGKTTTKEMIAAALETKYRVLKTAGNMNSQVGLPLTMFRLEHTHEVAVIEMGMSEPGEMCKLARIAKPTHAVITNIGVSHIGQLGSKENIRKEKMNIVDEFKEGSTLFVNGTDELLADILSFSENIQQKDIEKTQKNGSVDLSEKSVRALQVACVVSYGVGDGCTYQAKDVKVVGEHTEFSLDGEAITLQVLGEHNVYNATVALAVAEKLGIDKKTAKQGLFKYLPLAMRGEIEKVHGITIIDDTYNASPDSMRSGINILLGLPSVNKRYAVLADVLELGEHSYSCHYGVGEYIATKDIDVVVTVGEESKAIVKAIRDKQAPITTISFVTNEEAITYLQNRIQAKDAVFIKGSRGMHTDEIVAALKA